MAYMRPRILAGSTGPGMLRAYIESNLAFMRENRNALIAVSEIARSGLTADGRERFHGRADAIDEAVKVLGGHLVHYQAVGDFRTDFDPNVMAVAIRAAMDAVLQRYVRDPDLDVDNYAREIVTVFDLANPCPGYPVTGEPVNGRTAPTAGAHWWSSSPPFNFLRDGGCSLC